MKCMCELFNWMADVKEPKQLTMREGSSLFSGCLGWNKKQCFMDDCCVPFYSRRLTKEQLPQTRRTSWFHERRSIIVQTWKLQLSEFMKYIQVTQLITWQSHHWNPGVTAYIPEILDGGNPCPLKAEVPLGADWCFPSNLELEKFRHGERALSHLRPALLTLNHLKVKDDN